MHRLITTFLQKITGILSMIVSDNCYSYRIDLAG